MFIKLLLVQSNKKSKKINDLQFNLETMTTDYLLKLSLTVHIVGLTIAGGISLINYLTIRKFWKVFPIDKQKGTTIITAITKLPWLVWIGLVMLILSGAVMMYVAYSVFMEQLWFKLKLVLIILIIANGLMGSRFTGKLRKVLLNGGEQIKDHNSIFSIKKPCRVQQLFNFCFFC